eukprot:TRINITY_DN5165_c0_g1_i1.p2 TRINITY_DN5165_c0_g1~~TRINITY_DN5165_c0_g1_i1.p2  ORF type:complete len:140 (+),score=22.25 TRINITY_DN5165_c0_g1_i1:35-454(+)
MSTKVLLLVVVLLLSVPLRAASGAGGFVVSKTADGSALVEVTDPRNGIGRLAVPAPVGGWPSQVTVRLPLHALEQFDAGIAGRAFSYALPTEENHERGLHPERDYGPIDVALPATLFATDAGATTATADLELAWVDFLR